MRSRLDYIRKRGHSLVLCSCKVTCLDQLHARARAAVFDSTDQNEIARGHPRQLDLRTPGRISFLIFVLERAYYCAYALVAKTVVLCRRQKGHREGEAGAERGAQRGRA